jgi:hypothetical protein
MDNDDARINAIIEAGEARRIAAGQINPDILPFLTEAETEELTNYKLKSMLKVAEAYRRRREGK